MNDTQRITELEEQLSQAHEESTRLYNKLQLCKQDRKRWRNAADRAIGLEGARDAIHEIQDILKVGRTYSLAVTAVKELVKAMGG